MLALGRAALFLAGFTAPMVLSLDARASAIDVATGAVANLAYPATIQSGGPYPWSDFGVTAAATITPGPLTAVVGGSTSFAFDTALSGGETLTAGSTTFDLGYTSAWVGFLLTSATGNLNSNFVYNVGPFNGSTTIINAGAGTHTGTNLVAALTTGGVAAASSSAATGVGSISGTLSATAGPCPACVTVASVSVGVSVSAKLTQTVSASPTVQYGDLLWYSKTPTYSAADNPIFVAGSGGTVQNLFTTPPASLGITVGQQFYLNLLPAVQLTMPISDAADLAVPASLNINGQIFGQGFGTSFPLGNLYDLSTGTDTFDFDAAWYGSQFYSIPVQLTSECSPFAACSNYEIPGGDGLGTGDVDIPTNLLPPGSFTFGPWPGSLTGPGTTNMGPLFPNGPCPPGVAAGSASCISQISFTPIPEPGSLVLLVTGLVGAVLLRRACPWSAGQVLSDDLFPDA